MLTVFNPVLKSSMASALKLGYHNLRSTVAFGVNLRRYDQGPSSSSTLSSAGYSRRNFTTRTWMFIPVMAYGKPEVRRCRLSR